MVPLSPCRARSLRRGPAFRGVLIVLAVRGRGGSLSSGGLPLYRHLAVARDLAVAGRSRCSRRASSTKYDAHSVSHIEDRYTFYLVPLLLVALLRVGSTAYRAVDGRHGRLWPCDRCRRPDLRLPATATSCGDERRCPTRSGSCLGWCTKRRDDRRAAPRRARRSGLDAGPRSCSSIGCGRRCCRGCQCSWSSCISARC